MYRILLSISTSVEIEPKQLLDLGMSEVQQIRRDISVTAAKTGFQGSVDDFLAHARSDPTFYFRNEEELLAAYRRALQEIVPLLPRVVRDIPKLSISVEGTHGGAAAWYEAPTAKHDTDIVHVDVGTPSIHPKFEVTPLMLHEGLPGHTLQHAVARESATGNADVVTAFVKQARQSTGFVEGWGLYSETVGYNLGLYRTPMEEFGALRMKLTRAVRIVVDTGVHMSGWTLEQAKSYAAANTGEPEQIDLEVGRVILPGVQPAYTVGEKQIEAMRDAVAKRLGQKFNLRAFDDVMLRWGPLPLQVMRQKVNDCLANEQCSRIFANSGNEN